MRKKEGQEEAHEHPMKQDLAPSECTLCLLDLSVSLEKKHLSAELSIVPRTRRAMDIHREGTIICGLKA